MKNRILTEFLFCKLVYGQTNNGKRSIFLSPDSLVRVFSFLRRVEVISAFSNVAMKQLETWKLGREENTPGTRDRSSSSGWTTVPSSHCTESNAGNWYLTTIGGPRLSPSCLKCNRRSSCSLQSVLRKHLPSIFWGSRDSWRKLEILNKERNK